MLRVAVLAACRAGVKGDSPTKFDVRYQLSQDNRLRRQQKQGGKMKLLKGKSLQKSFSTKAVPPPPPVLTIFRSGMDDMILLFLTDVPLCFY